MIDEAVFENKKAAYYTLGCKLNFAETSTIGKELAAQRRKSGCPWPPSCPRPCGYAHQNAGSPTSQ